MNPFSACNTNIFSFKILKYHNQQHRTWQYQRIDSDILGTTHQNNPSNSFMTVKTHLLPLKRWRWGCLKNTTLELKKWLPWCHLWVQPLGALNNYLQTGHSKRCLPVAPTLTWPSRHKRQQTWVHLSCFGFSRYASSSKQKGHRSLSSLSAILVAPVIRVHLDEAKACL